MLLIAQPSLQLPHIFLEIESLSQIRIVLTYRAGLARILFLSVSLEY